MALTDDQRSFLTTVAALCDEAKSDGVFTAVSEWLGYLPYGAYVWVEVAGRAIDDERFPRPWGSGDLEALVRAGCLEQLGVESTGDDPHDRRVTCRVLRRE